MPPATDTASTRRHAPPPPRAKPPTAARPPLAAVRASDACAPEPRPPTDCISCCKFTEKLGISSFQECCSTKDAAAANEQRLSAELSTVTKLAELHKESSEEWSKKARELEVVIKASETHLTQVEDEYKEKLEKETLSRRDLEKVLHEIEEKAELILDERAEHERMAEAYALVDQKLQQALLEHDNFESIIRNLKSELKRREHDYSVAQKEIDDLHKQVLNHIDDAVESFKETLELEPDDGVTKRDLAAAKKISDRRDQDMKVAVLNRKKPIVTAREPDASGDCGNRYMKLWTRRVFMAPSRQPPTPRALGLAEAAGANQVAVLATGLPCCSSTASVDVGQERISACRSDTTEAGDNHILQDSALNLGNGTDRERRMASLSRAHFQAGQKKAQAKRIAPKSKMWTEDREMEFLTHYLDLLATNKDFRVLRRIEKFEVIAEIMTQNSRRLFSDKQLKDKFTKLMSLYNVYISPEVRRSKAWWKKRNDPAFKKVRNGECFAIFPLIRKIVEIEKSKAKA